MKRPRLSLLLVSVLTVCGVHSSRVWAQGAPLSAQQDRTRTLFRQAAAAFSAGKSDEARKLLLEAWNIRRTYDVAAALGQAELDLKLYRDAAEHLAYAVENFAPAESAQSLDELKRDSRTAKAHVAEVHVNVVNGAGVNVFANTLQLGTVPLAATVFLDPGSYQMEARRGGQVVARSARKFEENGSYTVDLVVPAGAGSPVSSGLSDPGSAPPPVSSSANPDASPLRGIALVTGGTLAVAGLAMGIGFGIASNSAEEDANKYRSRFPTTACTSGAAPDADCQGLASAVSKQDRDGSIATVGWVLGAVGATAVGVALLWPHDDAERKQASTRQLSLGWQGNRLLLRGTF